MASNSSMDLHLEASMDGAPPAESTTGLSRHEKSLGLLTSRFVHLLQNSKDGVLDLKQAADTLAVKQKRRIYDITNVLEGIGLIEKRSKNSIQWKGAGPGANTRDVSDRLSVLKREIEELDHHEKTLEEHKNRIQQSIKNVSDDQSNHQSAYVTHEDICQCFKDSTLLAIQAPSGTTLEVPIPEGLNIGGYSSKVGPQDLRNPAALKRSYQIHLKSCSGPINVLLVNKESENSKPVAVVVPPPKQDETTSESPTKKLMLDSPLPNVTISASPKALVSVESPKTKLRSSPRRSAVQHEKNNCNMDGEQELVTPGGLFGATQHTEYSVDDLLSSDMFSPLLRLSPPPNDRDYYFNLDDTEGVADLFDIPVNTYP